MWPRCSQIYCSIPQVRDFSFYMVQRLQSSVSSEIAKLRRYSYGVFCGYIDPMWHEGNVSLNANTEAHIQREAEPKYEEK